MRTMHNDKCVCAFILVAELRVESWLEVFCTLNALNASTQQRASGACACIFEHIQKLTNVRAPAARARCPRLEESG
eukprot:scaffold109167_cov21-Tisochrysis_lutea.AAC.1